jgi:hypothetical protein
VRDEAVPVPGATAIDTALMRVPSIGKAAVGFKGIILSFGSEVYARSDA